MVKIDRSKIVKAAVGSARLEGYKGTPKAADEKRPDERILQRSVFISGCNPCRNTRHEPLEETES